MLQVIQSATLLLLVLLAVLRKAAIVILIMPMPALVHLVLDIMREPLAGRPVLVRESIARALSRKEVRLRPRKAIMLALCRNKVRLALAAVELLDRQTQVK